MKRRRHKERQRQTQESGEDAPFQGSQAKEGGRKKRKVGKQMGASTDKEVPGARNRQGGQVRTQHAPAVVSNKRRFPTH